MQPGSPGGFVAIAGVYNAVTGTPALPVVIDSTGQLGTTASSERFKKDIRPMNSSSDVILSLKPVTFHYKNDNTDTPQFGLVAEDVAKVDPDLVARDSEGNIYTVRYDAVNAMLLNEFLKEHKKVDEQETTITRLSSTVAKQEATIAQLKAAAAKQEAVNTEQRKGMEVVAARLKEQDAKIQRSTTTWN